MVTAESKSDRGLALERVLGRVFGGLFVAALCGVAFAYGVATQKLKIFPYRILHEASAALDAWRQVDNDGLPPIFLSWEAPPARLARTLSPNAGTEPIFMTGGFYVRQDMCPKVGCLAWTMDRQGRVLRTWPAPDPAALFTGLKNRSGVVKPLNFYVFGAAETSDGGLVVTFHGYDIFPYQIGIAKFDRAGKLVWKRLGENHHYHTLGPDGLIYTPYTKLGPKGGGFAGGTAVPITCGSGGAPYMEGIQVLDPSGRLLREFPMDKALIAANYPGLLYSVRDGCDPMHINSIDLVNATGAARLGVKVGDLLVSIREAGALVVMDQNTGAIRRVISGRTGAQHGPRFMPDGSILVFDNLGGDRTLGGSRVVRIQPEGAVETIFPRGAVKGLTPFYSRYQGRVEASADGARVLISSSQQGRLIEVDLATGEPLWVYENVTDLGPFVRARNLRTQQTHARMEAHGADYAGN